MAGARPGLSSVLRSAIDGRAGQGVPASISLSDQHHEAQHLALGGPAGLYRGTKDKVASLKAWLVQRYGKAGAAAILGSGQALSWGATGVGALMGVPLFIPGSSILGALPALGIAELIHRYRQKGQAQHLADGGPVNEREHLQSRIKDIYDRILAGGLKERERKGLLAEHRQHSESLARLGKGPAAAATPPTTDDADPVQAVLAAVQAQGGDVNLASLVKVREHLAQQGLTTRAQQDAAIEAARRKGLVTGSAIEGRHGVGKDELAAALPSPGTDQKIGFLSIKQLAQGGMAPHMAGGGLAKAPLSLLEQFEAQASAQRARREAAQKQQGQVPNQALGAESRPSLTPQESEALFDYSDDGFKRLNQDLLQGKTLAGSAAKIDQHLQSAFGKTRDFETPQHVTRAFSLEGQSLQDFLAKYRQAMESNQPVESPSYVSTTTNLEGKQVRKGNVVMEIAARRGLDVRPHTEHMTHENELLLNRGSQFSVLGMENRGGTWHLKLAQALAAGGGVRDAGDHWLQRAGFQPQGTDTQPARVPQGSYVVNRDSAQANPGLMQQLGAATVPAQPGQVADFTANQGNASAAELTPGEVVVPPQEVAANPGLPQQINSSHGALHLATGGPAGGSAAADIGRRFDVPAPSGFGAAVAASFSNATGEADQVARGMMGAIAGRVSTLGATPPRHAQGSPMSMTGLPNFDRFRVGLQQGADTLTRWGHGLSEASGKLAMWGAGLTASLGGFVRAAGGSLFETLSLSAQLAAGALGQALIPQVLWLSGKLQGLAEFFRDLSPATKSLIGYTAAAAVGLTVLGVGARLVGSGLSAIGSLVGGVNTVLGFATKALVGFTTATTAASAATRAGAVNQAASGAGAGGLLSSLVNPLGLLITGLVSAPFMAMGQYKALDLNKELVEDPYKRGEIGQGEVAWKLIKGQLTGGGSLLAESMEKEQNKKPKLANYQEMAIGTHRVEDIQNIFQQANLEKGGLEKEKMAQDRETWQSMLRELKELNRKKNPGLDQFPFAP